MLTGLFEKLRAQIADLDAEKEVEILINTDNREKPTGKKRNELLERACGDYVVFIDDDDTVYPYYLAEIMKAIQEEKDCIAINGIITTNGRNMQSWHVNLNYNYETKDGKYFRFPNHITPIKRAIAQKFKFKEINFGEDFDWALQIRESGLLKTQAIIEPPVYHYQYRTGRWKR